MPVTDKLGTDVLEALDGALGDVPIPEFQPDGLTFEAWLSWLAERQPYEDEAESLLNQSRFVRVQQAVADVLVTAQRLAVEHLPPWLDQFVDLAHHEESAVITLNYDTLLEDAVNGRGYYDKDSRQHLGAGDGIVGFPNGHSIGHVGPAGFRNYRTMKVHKLHGSTDWFAVPGDRTGATLQRIPRRSNEDEHRATVGGRSAFIVPPTATKDTYFDNPTTRFIWQEARLRLSEADRVVMMGYSLPITDAAIASLLSRTLGRSEAEIVIVNPDAGAIASKLTKLGASKQRIRTVDGRDCVERFVDEEIGVASGRLLTELRGRLEDSPGAPLQVGWPSHMSSIGRIERSDGTLTLHTADFGNPSNIARPGTVLSEGPTAPTTRTLSEVLSRDVGVKLLQATDGRTTWAVVGYIDDPALSNNHGRLASADTLAANDLPDWIALRLAGRSPES